LGVLYVTMVSLSEKWGCEIEQIFKVDRSAEYFMQVENMKAESLVIV